MAINVKKMLKSKFFFLKDRVKVHAKRRKSFIIILLVYIVLVTIYYYYFLHEDQWYCTKEFLETIEPGFAVSFSASLLEDLIIFIALSFIILLLTTKDIFDYNFGEKITAIINSDDSDNPQLHEYLKITVARLLAYDKRIKFHLTVTEYDTSKNAYKIFFIIEYVIKNMCRDKDFVLDEDYWFFVGAADTAVGNDFGFVTSFITKKSGEKPTIYVDETKPHKLDKKFEKKIDLKISKDKNFKIKLRYNAWSQTGDNFKIEKEKLNFYNYVQSKRYVEKVEIVVKNQLNRPLNYEILINEKQKNEIKLLSLRDNGLIQSGNQSKIEINDGLFPKDNAIVYFHKP